MARASLCLGMSSPKVLIYDNGLILAKDTILPIQFICDLDVD